MRLSNIGDKVALPLGDITYNCTGLYADRTAFIQNFINETSCDMIFLQETWLHETQFDEVRKISKQFLCHNVSGISNREMIKSSRGKGGVSTMWKKTLANRIKPLPIEHERLVSVIFNVSDEYNLLIINAYMPNDNYKAHEASLEFQNECDNIEQVIQKYSDKANGILLVGDMNVDLKRNNAHSYLSTFENFSGVESARQLVSDILPIARGRYK